jgi:ribosome-associated translation inhibitor RaiA
MQTPLQITVRHLQPSPAVEARVREYVERLERFHQRITGCQVIVEAPAAHRHKGAPFNIKIALSLPAAEINVHSERSDDAAHTDVYVALRDAFAIVKRCLKDHAREHTHGVPRLPWPTCARTLPSKRS